MFLAGDVELNPGADLEVKHGHINCEGMFILAQKKIGTSESQK